MEQWAVEGCECRLSLMLSAVEYSHLLLRGRLLPGDMAVDATAGNGHDTIFLARLTGSQGKVFAFDVQALAIAATRQLLQSHLVPDNCYQLICGSHSTMPEHLPPELKGCVAAVIFNLGYLPGGDKSLVTRTETTLPAVVTAMEFLRPGGMLILVLYPGHPSGAEEAQALRELAMALPSKHWQVSEYRTLNAKNAPPFVLAIEKAEPASELIFER